MTRKLLISCFALALLAVAGPGLAGTSWWQDTPRVVPTTRTIVPPGGGTQVITSNPSGASVQLNSSGSSSQPSIIEQSYLAASAYDASIFVTNGKAGTSPSTSTTHFIVVSNMGTSPINVSAAWSYSTTGTASRAPGAVTYSATSGSTCSIVGTAAALSLPVGGSVTVMPVSNLGAGVGTLTISSVATITTSGAIDANLTDNTSSDTDTVP